MKISIKVKFLTPAGVAVDETVTTSLSTVVAWERHFKRKASEFGAGQIGIEDVTFLAWHRLTVLKREDRSFDHWLESVEEIEVVELGDSGPPTKPDTSGAN